MSIESTASSTSSSIARPTAEPTTEVSVEDSLVSYQHNILRQQIVDSLRKAETQKGRLKRTDRRFSIAHIILSALAAVITGQSAASGEAIIMNWKVTAAVASTLGIGTTVIAGIQKQIVSPDLLEEASECVAKLKALKVETITLSFDLEEVSEEYQQLLAQFSNIDC